MSLPVNKMYAVRHGQTNKIWMFGEMWMWSNIDALKEAWTIAQDCGLVGSNLCQHKIVIIELVEKS